LFPFLGDDFGLAVAARELHQGCSQFGLEGRHVEFEVGRLRQPARVRTAQHLLVECQAKAARLEAVENLDAGGNGLWCGAFGQGGHFQHDFVGVNELKVPACQALVRAVDEDGELAHQRLGATIRQRIEQ
jgi:hypothetical protein